MTPTVEGKVSDDRLAALKVQLDPFAPEHQGQIAGCWIEGEEVDEIISALTELQVCRSEPSVATWTRADLLEAMQVSGFEAATIDDVDDVLAHLSLCGDGYRAAALEQP